MVLFFLLRLCAPLCMVLSFIRVCVCSLISMFVCLFLMIRFENTSLFYRLHSFICSFVLQFPTVRKYPGFAHLFDRSIVLSLIGTAYQFISFVTVLCTGPCSFYPSSKPDIKPRIYQSCPTFVAMLVLIISARFVNPNWERE